MTLRWFIYIAFLILVVGISKGAQSLGQGSKAPPAIWKSSTDIVLNTRITQRHLQPPDFPTPASSWGLPKIDSLEGKYAVCNRNAHNKEMDKIVCISKAQEVMPNLLSPVPMLSDVEGTVLLFLRDHNLTPQASQINAGARVYVCESDQPCNGRAYVVETILTESNSIVVVIRVNKTEAVNIRNLVKPNLQIAALP